MGWNGDISQMGKLEERIADLASVPSRAARAVASGLALEIEEEFADGRDPYGDPWAPLAPATIDKGRFPPPLTDTAAMRKSVAVRPMVGAGVAITVDHPAQVHQTGWSGKSGTGPARPVLPSRAMPPAWEEIIEAAVTKAVGT
jgi:hypothetical protein